MEQVMLSDNERLITLTKKAYDEMNEKIQTLERERENNTIRLFTAREINYYRDKERWWDRVTIDAYFPERIKSKVSEFVNDCEKLKADIEKSFKDLDSKFRELERKQERIEKQKLVPKWILRLCRIKLT